MLFNELVEQILTEVRAVRKKVVRRGKVIKKRDCPPGYRLVNGNRCVRQSSRERNIRRRAGRKAARKSKSKRRISRKRSVKVRQRRHLKRVRY